MPSSLLATALLMGLVGGPHCIAMCGAACAGIGQAAGARSSTALWLFQAGRWLGYGALGALAAASMQGLGWLTVQSAALRPLWSMVHVAAVVLGLALLVLGRQPVWLEQGARQVWQRVRARVQTGTRAAPLLLGVCWALLPCGLLYSALLVAALAPSVLAGGLVMVAFSMGTSVALVLGPWLWLRLKNGGALGADGAWGVRLAGAALAGSAAWGLYLGLVHQQAPWCITP
ncbi:MAG: sulfite exporter TauE/SafE family protein [Rhodoferax sp.]